MSNEIPTTSTLEEAIAQIKKLGQESTKPILVAIDGRSGTGKSTIAKKITSDLEGTEINTDNFWSGGTNEQWDNKSPQEKADQAIDWKRLRREVLEILLAGEVARWHSFDWEKGEGLSPVEIVSYPSRTIIIDGAYSTRPELQDLITLSVFIELSNENVRRERLVLRENQEYMNDWHARWDEAEDYYFTEVRPREKFDIIINND